jgi:hypothetical protein
MPFAVVGIATFLADEVVSVPFNAREVLVTVLVGSKVVIKLN